MPDQRPLIERLLDVVVYAPIGLLGQLQEEVPKFAAEGRQKFENRVQVAKFIGQMSVTYGRQEVARKLAERSQRAAATPAPVVDDSPPEASFPDDAAAAAAVTAPESAPLPFDGYDTMAAAHIVQQLRRMARAELDAVEAYEQQHRNRRTVLAKIDQIRLG